MASITSLSNASSVSSIYGNRNVLSGLASGMDTESMIENAVSGIKLKIQNLQKKRTKVEWQQEAYRSIIDKMANFTQKYTSYSSSTNLLSNSFFSSAVKTTANGTYADKISATGKTSSNVQLLGVRQLATAATYRVSGLGGITDSQDVTGEEMDLGSILPQSNVSGTMTLKYGGARTVDLSFDELDTYDNVTELAAGIRKKLDEIQMSTSSGESKKASEVIGVSIENGNIVFSDLQGAGNSVTVGSSTGKIKDTLGIDSSAKSNKLAVSGKTLVDRTATRGDYLSGKSVSVTLDGVTKKITMPEYEKDMTGESYLKSIQDSLDKAFGAGRITVDTSKGSSEDGKFSLRLSAAQAGSTLSVTGTSATAMGLPSGGDSNYVNTGRKLGDLLGEDKWKTMVDGLSPLKAEGEIREVKDKNGNVTHHVDEKGNRVKQTYDGWVRVDDQDEYLYDFKVNGVSVGQFSKNTALESVMTAINSNADAGVKVSYSKMTNEFCFTATETGSAGKIELEGLSKNLFGTSGMADKLSNNFAENYGINLPDGVTREFNFNFGSFSLSFDVDNKMTMQDLADKLNQNMGPGYAASYNEETGQFNVTKNHGGAVDFTVTDSLGFDYERQIAPVANYTAGQDAIVDVKVNGVLFEGMVRSSNTFDVDGLKITAKGTFETKDGDDPVTFTTSSDSDKIVDAVRSLVEDYNAMVTEIKNAYSTMPATKNGSVTGKRYEPLTDEDKASMSQSAIEAYEEKAKQGILFGDSNLSSLYSKLLSAVSPGGSDGQTLREIGINTSYNNGLTTLSLDETALRNALESDPDKVANAFTKSRESGSSSNGLMQSLLNPLNTYAKTTGEPKGVLITHAGSIKAPTTINSNTLQSQLNSIDAQIERWENKMSSQIDRYTTQFSRLEQLIAEMNSQSSAMQGLMGGYGSY